MEIKKLLLIAFFSLLININAFADVLVIVKNKIDKNIFIKRTKITKELAIEEAMKGCAVLFQYNESINKEKRQKMTSACYVYKVLNL